MSDIDTTLNIVLCDETAIDVVLHEDHNDIHVTIGDDTAIDVEIQGSIGTVPEHNLLTGLQGGTTDEYYHLLEAEYTELTEWLNNVVLGSTGVTQVPQLVLIPSAAALEAIEGGMFYNNADKSIYVCTDI